jgi:hypothetical protein
VVTDTAAAHRTERGRVVPFIAGHSCLAAAAARDGCPRLNGRLVRNLSKQTCQEAKRGERGTALKQPRAEVSGGPEVSGVPTVSRVPGSVECGR